MVELDRCATDMLTAVRTSPSGSPARPGDPGASARRAVPAHPVQAQRRSASAVIGCGNISNQYLRNLTGFPDLAVLICADLDESRAKAQAAAYGVPEWGSPADALAHPGVRARS